MRLICPNCGAQYEVDAAMIPADGRDVQCSNCVTTWFQPGKHDVDQAPAAARIPVDAVPEDVPAPIPAPTEPPQPRRQGTSAGALEIIRQEAAREARMRAAEALETQEEMPLDMPADTAERGRQARAQIAGLTRPEAEAPTAKVEADLAPGAAPEPEADAAPDLAPAPQPPTIAPGKPAEAEADPTAQRRDLLPDIEEINSTLRPDDVAREQNIAAVVETRRPTSPQRAGRRFGFGFVMAAVVIAAIAYVTAGSLAQAVPDAAPVLTVYVAWVNDLRVQLNEVFTQLTTLVNTLNAR